MAAETDSDSEFAPEPCTSSGTVPAWRFRLVVLRYHRLVYRFAWSLLKDRSEAEDVVQDAFLKYWQQGHGVRTPKEWLLSVVHNGCLDRHRRTRRLVAVESAGVEEPSHERGPVALLQQRELAARLNTLISELPEPQRSLLVLFDVHGLDGATCARILGLNVNQVKVYLHRTRRRLRQSLEEES